MSTAYLVVSNMQLYIKLYVRRMLACDRMSVIHDFKESDETLNEEYAERWHALLFNWLNIVDTNSFLIKGDYNHMSISRSDTCILKHIVVTVVKLGEEYQ